MKECNVSYGESSLRVRTRTWVEMGLSASMTPVLLINARLKEKYNTKLVSVLMNDTYYLVNTVMLGNASK